MGFGDVSALLTTSLTASGIIVSVAVAPGVAVLVTVGVRVIVGVPVRVKEGVPVCVAVGVFCGV